MTAVSELEIYRNETSVPAAVEARSASSKAPSTEILGIAANLRSARLIAGDRCFLFCPASEVNRPGSLIDQVALGLLHLDGPPVLVIHLHRCEDEPDARQAAARYSVIKGSLMNPPQPSLCLAYPMPGGNTASLVSRQFTDMVVEARKQFNYILIDCPPLANNPAALLLSPGSDRSIITVPAGRARRTEVQSSCDSLRRAGAKLMGFVLIRG